MQPAVLRALEFDRIREALAREASTPFGRERALAIEPSVEAAAVRERLDQTTEAKTFLEAGGSLAIDAGDELPAVLDALDVAAEPLLPLQLLSLARFTESVESVGRGVTAGASSPLLGRIAAAIASFASETAAVRRAIQPAGDIADDASPALRDIRDALRRQRAKLRSTLEGLTRGRDTAKYLQDQIITDRNGRYVVVVRAEHRGAIPGLVHGASASGASLYLEPLTTVELNNDIVALGDREKDEIHRILAGLTEAFRRRGPELAALTEAAAELDELQAKARLALRLAGTAPQLAADGRIEFRGARHPLLGPALAPADADRTRAEPTPSDLTVVPPTRVLVISGPNTGGKTVALKACGLLSVMAQSGLLIPVEAGSTFTPFRSVFADIGDEQSIAASLSTFSARVANLVEMNRALVLPALILLDELGSGTDPVEGGALGAAVLDHFRRRGAVVVATTHDDALKSYAATTAEVAAAAFGFNPDTYAPTYRLVYGAPGRSLALEIAERLGLPASLVADARSRRSGRESQLAAHLARVDAELSALERQKRLTEEERGALARERRALLEREMRLAEREAVLKTRLDDKLNERLREARAEVDAVVAELKTRAGALAAQAERRGPVLSTGDVGGLRAHARAALDTIGASVEGAGTGDAGGGALDSPPAIGQRVLVPAFGTDGIVRGVSGKNVEVEIRGKRMRVRLTDLRAAGQAGGAAAERPGHLNARKAASREIRQPGAAGPVHLPSAELVLIGATVEDALARAEKFLDSALLADERRLRIVHGHGTGRLRDALRTHFREHALVASVSPAPDNEGGQGATIVELKD